MGFQLLMYIFPKWQTPAVDLRSSPGHHGSGGVGDWGAVVSVFAFLGEVTVSCCMAIMLRVANQGMLEIRI